MAGIVWLGIEASTARTSIALGREEQVLAERRLDTRRDLSRRLVAEVASVFEAEGLEPSGLGAVAVGLGPGGFTGLRVVVATAKALAQALSIPVVGIPTLELLAYQMLPLARQAEALCPLLDARRGEFFTALYAQAHNGVDKEREEQVISHTELGGFATSLGRPVLVGGPVEGLDPTLLGPGARAVTLWPEASALIGLAHMRLAEQGPDDVMALRPIYVRPSYAEEAQASERQTRS